jgi:C-terminal processing protease CtpA/Prc
MIRRLFSLALAFSAFHRLEADPGEALSRPELEAALGFEHKLGGPLPDGWSGGPPGTIFPDTEAHHTAGKSVARIERRANGPGQFSTLTKSIPMGFKGAKIELRGFLRTEEVSDFAGLWMREDGEGGPVEFDNMEARQLKGTTQWSEYSIALPLNPGARTLFFGFLLVGTGRAWASEFQLLVDGKPVWDAPKAEIVLTILDRDHEFDKGSGIPPTALTPVQIKSLAALARTWGFLKYHHPKVMAGQLQWDYELFRIMPAVLAAANQVAADEVIAHWTEALGEVAPGARVGPQEADVALRPDVAWINDKAALGDRLSERLRAIWAGGPALGGQFYVSMVPGVGNPEFAHELGYPAIKLPDAGYQMLSLFRLWNIVRYWYPYRDLVAENWDDVLTEFIPRFGSAATSHAYKLQLFALLAKVSDTHANLWSSLDEQPPVGQFQWPVVVRYIQGRPVVTQVLETEGASSARLLRGDVILSIDGTPVGDLVESWSEYYPASNEPTRLRGIARAMGRGPAGPSRIRVQRGGETIDVDVSRTRDPGEDGSRLQHDIPGPAFRLLSKDVAYLKLSAVKAADAVSYVQQAAGTKGWIIDIRNYPTEFVVFALGSHLVSSPTAFVRFTCGSLSRPGEFSFTEPLSLTPEKPLYSGKIVILVDEATQSSAEYTAMAFRSVPGAIVLGSTTAGADGNVSRIRLPGGLQTMISGIGVYYPDRRPTQRIGIVPDIEVQPTVEGIRAGRDEVLEEALRQIVGPQSTAGGGQTGSLPALRD